MGEWKRAELGYLKAHATYCDLCGQLVPGRYWEAVVEGEPHVFCSPLHEQKYVSYWLPRYGKEGVR